MGCCQKGFMDKIYRILYSSSVCSEQMIEYLFTTSKIKPILSAHKYHKLLLKGLINHNCKVTALTAIPASKPHKKLFWFCRSEYEEGIKFIYPYFMNWPLVRHILIFLNSFTISLVWCLRKSNNSYIVCDILNVSISSAVRLAAFITKTPVIAVVTDLPLMQVEFYSAKSSIIASLAMWFSNFSLSRYDAFIFLTQAMNKVNSKRKPYVIVEGICDGSRVNRNRIGKDTTRNIIYTGGLYEVNGIKRLVQAFMKLEFDDIRLFLYGSGELEPYLVSCMKEDNRIYLFGMQPNDIVVEAQIRATLLVNPRPSHEEFTIYSFPSKNIEYMASGTSLVTTALPGIPREYLDYVYIFNDESTEGIYRTLNDLLLLPNEELMLRGHIAKEFVVANKNEKVQSKKVMELFKLLD